MKIFQKENKVFFLNCFSVDEITIPSRLGKGLLQRVPEVFDCLFDSGSMAYAQVHYPFDERKTFMDTFPADFIAEGIYIESCSFTLV
jgi:isoleucyl-tRNA synthetase